MFAAAVWYYGPGWLLVSRLTLGCALIVLFAIDLEHHLLPNVITVPQPPLAFSTPASCAARISAFDVASGVWLPPAGNS